VTAHAMAKPVAQEDLGYHNGAYGLRAAYLLTNFKII